MDLGLKGKVAVVTGGSVGIGLAIAEGLAAEGVDLVLAARDSERVRQEANRIAAAYRVRADPVACDVATREGTDALLEATQGAHGGADILINNAGSGSNETVMEAADDKWQAYWELHVMAAVRLARGLAPLMKARGGGVILHNASICAVQPLVVRADLQHHQSGADDVLEMSLDRTRRRQHPGQLRQPRAGPHARLDQDRQAAHRGDRAATGRDISTASPTNSRRSSVSPHPRSSRMCSSFSVPNARATPSARRISSTAAG